MTRFGSDEAWKRWRCFGLFHQCVNFAPQGTFYHHERDTLRQIFIPCYRTLQFGTTRALPSATCASTKMPWSASRLPSRSTATAWTRGSTLVWRTARLASTRKPSTACKRLLRSLLSTRTPLNGLKKSSCSLTLWAITRWGEYYILFKASDLTLLFNVGFGVTKEGWWFLFATTVW